MKIYHYLLFLTDELRKKSVLDQQGVCLPKYRNKFLSQNNVPKYRPDDMKRFHDKTNYGLMRLLATARSLKNLRRFRPHCWLQLPLLPTCHLTSFLTFLLRNSKFQKRVESLSKRCGMLVFAVWCVYFLSNVVRCHSELYTVDFGNS